MTLSPKNIVQPTIPIPVPVFFPKVNDLPEVISELCHVCASLMCIIIPSPHIYHYLFKEQEIMQK